MAAVAKMSSGVCLREFSLSPKQLIGKQLSSNVPLRHGLRPSEVLELVPADIGLKRVTVTTRCSMGKKGRIVPLPLRLLAPMRV